MLNRRPELATNAMKDPGVPHPRNDQPSPYHIGRRPRSTQLAQAPPMKTKDFSSANPVLPGPIWVIPLPPCAPQRIEGPRTGWCCRRTYQEMARLLGKILSPHPLLRVWATNALLRACFPGTHEAPSGTGATLAHTTSTNAKCIELPRYPKIQDTKARSHEWLT